MQYAEIEIYTHQNGINSIGVGATDHHIQSGGGLTWYFIGYHATNLSIDSWSGNTVVNMNTLINYLQTWYNCNLSSGGVVGITVGVESQSSYIGAYCDYVYYQC